MILRCLPKKEQTADEIKLKKIEEETLEAAKDPPKLLISPDSSKSRCRMHLWMNSLTLSQPTGMKFSP